MCWRSQERESIPHTTKIWVQTGETSIWRNTETLRRSLQKMYNQVITLINCSIVRLAFRVYSLIVTKQIRWVDVYRTKWAKLKSHFLFVKPLAYLLRYVSIRPDVLRNKIKHNVCSRVNKGMLHLTVTLRIKAVEFGKLSWRTKCFQL